MEMNNKILFVVEEGSLKYDIPGGVQLCTEEIIEYFKLTNFNLSPFLVKTTRRITDRIRIKLGVDTFNSFDFKKVADALSAKINEEDITLIALNQIGFAPLIPLVRKMVNRKLYFVAFSHGNESGDYLSSDQKSDLLKLWKLGKLMLKEHVIYKEYLDGVVVISEHEIGLNQWLGANKVFMLPRMLKDQYIDWQPVENWVGFVGTLNHGPNLIGLNLILKNLELLKFTGSVRIVGGPGEIGEKLSKEFACVQYVGKLNDAELIQEAKSWAVFLNPVFWYSRGSSTKLAQGMNWGIPVLTTIAGKRGYLLSDEKVILKDHEPNEFAKAIIEVCNDRKLLNGLQTSVKRNIEDFNEQVVANNLEDFLRSIIKWYPKTLSKVGES